MNIGVRSKSTIGYLAQLHDALESIDISRAQFPVSLTVAVETGTNWQWLHANEHLTRIVWTDRETSKVVAGLGNAWESKLGAGGDVSECIAHCQSSLRGNRQLRYFGGFSFDGNDAWQEFGAGRFVVPRLTISDDEMTLAIRNAEDIVQARLDLQEMVTGVKPTNVEVFPAQIAISFSPTIDGWQSRVDEALSLIRSEVLEKIVLSRKTTLKFAKSLNPMALVERLSAETRDCFVFCFNFATSSAFLGATPERLFFRQGDHLKSEVIAGTRMRGATPAEDEQLAIELLTSDKDQREHDIVRKSIRQKLHKFVDHLDVASQAAILRLVRKQHLKSDVSGKLKPGIDDGMLLKRLHPTPAVGGYPTDNALPEIARIEPFNRGWYAAPVGWIGAESVQFAVAIRSGLLKADTLSLFSGAGIVRGSEPEQEWMEVENKIQDFISILTS